MKYNITRVCGHEDTVEVFGTNVHGERDRKIAAEEKSMCQECFVKFIAEQNHTAGMVALTGSVKQIAWAEQIRHKIYSEVVKMPPTNDESAATKEKVLTGLKNKTEAKWWIDNQNERFATIGRKILGVIPD